MTTELQPGILKHYPESRFGGFSDVDGTMTFYQRVNSLLSADSVVLDVGCGRGAFAEDMVTIRRDIRILRGKAARVIGIDVDQAASSHPFLDEFRPITGQRWPIDDESVDLCICDNVLEHVSDPRRFLDESRRVLRPGGYLAVRTPNVMSYFGILSRIVPNRWHTGVAQFSSPDRRCEDVFSTVYQCNTRRRLERELRQRGFDACVYGYEAEPAYFSFSSVLYSLAVLHQRFAPRSIRVALFAFGRVPAALVAHSGER